MTAAEQARRGRRTAWALGAIVTVTAITLCSHDQRPVADESAATWAKRTTDECAAMLGLSTPGQRFDAGDVARLTGCVQAAQAAKNPR